MGRRTPRDEPTLAVLAAFAVGCTGQPLPPVPFADAVREVGDGARLVVVGDLQRTAPILQMWQEQNDPERERIVRAIGDLRPDLLAITGDCVFDGGSDAQWSAFDALVARLHAEGVPAVDAFGNHEYWLGRRAAEAHVFPRFPMDSGRHWFDVVFGPLRLIVLDANEGHLSDAERHTQIEWYVAELRRFDCDPEVRGVMVLFHEPPYTNSRVTGDDAQVQRDFVPPFEAAAKTLAMLNGHVHSYERFARKGKSFVVSGGGGGPRHELATGAERRHPDDLFVGPALRDFNFAVYTLTRAGVDAEVMGLPKRGTEVREMDHFGLPWPASPAPGSCRASEAPTAPESRASGAPPAHTNARNP